MYLCFFVVFPTIFSNDYSIIFVDVPRFVASAGDHISVNYRTSVRMGTVVQVGGDKLS